MKSLMKWSMTAGYCMLLGGFSGCSLLFEPEESSFTISGRLFEGLTDVPYANATMILEGYQRQGFSSDYVDLGTATTDEDGFFSITYERVFRDGKIGSGSEITLSINQPGLYLEILPWHTNISRDFASSDHSRLFVLLNEDYDGKVDSLYFTTSEIIPDSGYTLPISFPNQDYQAHVVKTDITSLKDGLLFKTRLGGSWNNSRVEDVLAYGKDIDELEKAVFAFHLDSIPDDFQRVTYDRRGFPFTDTIKLEL